MISTEKLALEQIRAAALKSLEAERQQALGQYFTPIAAAEIMAKFMPHPEVDRISILDPGAGMGVLSFALASRLLSEHLTLRVDITAFELDSGLHPYLRRSYELLQENYPLRVSFRILDTDFLFYALDTKEKYDLVIENPPYQKLPAKSDTRLALSKAGIDSPNLYSAFIELGLKVLAVNGHLVSITPRSFMNGTYFTPFRKRVLESNVIRSMHIFHSRVAVFSDTGVLQESIIVHWQKTPCRPPQVLIQSSVSQNDKFEVHAEDYELVAGGDFIYVPSGRRDRELLDFAASIDTKLSDLGLSISTGKVVDFRHRQNISSNKSSGSVPMIYPANIRDGEVYHPSGVKGQWFNPQDEQDLKMLIPAGTYVLLKRFSSKEERRRLSAAVLHSPEPVAIDNKLNYIHMGGCGLPFDLAVGVTDWLNSDMADSYFRLFSGHTQVNAGDMRSFPIAIAESLKA